MPDFPDWWFPLDTQAERAAKCAVQAFWPLIRDDATISEIRSAGYAAVGVPLPTNSRES